VVLEGIFNMFLVGYDGAAGGFGGLGFRFYKGKNAEMKCRTTEGSGSRAKTRRIS